MKCIPYKYVVLKQGNYEYEYIYKDDRKGIVNRCLSISENLLTQQGTETVLIFFCFINV